jgi:hypothetical protein
MWHSSNTHRATKGPNWQSERRRRDEMPTLVSEIQMLLKDCD